MAVAALVCGILGIIGGFIPVIQYFTFVLSILGIIFGVKARKAAAMAGAPSGMATAGFVLGIIGTSISGLGILCVICAAGVVGAGLSGL